MSAENENCWSRVSAGLAAIGLGVRGHSGEARPSGTTGSIRPAARLAGSMTLGCTRLVVLRLFFPSGGVVLGVPILYITRLSSGEYKSLNL